MSVRKIAITNQKGGSGKTKVGSYYYRAFVCRAESKKWKRYGPVVVYFSG